MICTQPKTQFFTEMHPLWEVFMAFHTGQIAKEGREWFKTMLFPIHYGNWDTTAAFKEVERRLIAAMEEREKLREQMIDSMLDGMVEATNEILIEAEVDYPAGREAGHRICFDEDGLRAEWRSLLRKHHP